VVVRLDIVLWRIPVYSVISDLKDLPAAFVGRSPSLLFDMSMDNGTVYKALALACESRLIARV